MGRQCREEGDRRKGTVRRKETVKRKETEERDSQRRQ